MRPLSLAIYLVCLSFLTHAAGSSGQLNDTGVSQAYDSGGQFPCSDYNTGDGATYPRQDCRFGRDAQAASGRLTKIGGGAAGFDFTPLDVRGNEIVVVNGKPASTPKCVRDNVTNLIWEAKSSDGGLHDAKWHYVWHDSNFSTNGGYPGSVGPDFCGGTVAAGCDTENFAAAVNSEGYCGPGRPWRMPTRRELLSIVHNGLLPVATVQIDRDFFPNENPVEFAYTYGGSFGSTRVSCFKYWSSDTYRPSPSAAWAVDMRGGTSASVKDYFIDGFGPHWLACSVRLVRDAQ